MQGQRAEAANEEGEGVLDRAHLDRATFGDPALRREVLTLFDRQAAQLAAEIAAAAEPAARAEAAHRLRGAALGIGANTVAEAAGACEDAPDDAGAVARLSARVAEARAALSALLARG